MEEKVLTVRERLTLLEQEIRNFEYPNRDIGLFVRTLPRKIKYLKSYIIAQSSQHPELIKCLENLCFDHLDHEMGELKKVDGSKPHPEGISITDDLRKTYLKYTKDYVSKSIEEFFKCCRKLKIDIPSQKEIEVGN